MLDNPPYVKQKHQIIVGIDSGVNTGISVYDRHLKRLTLVSCTKIHSAMKLIESLMNNELFKNLLLVRVEDARKRKWFGNSGREQLQGAGSIKRDATIWEDFLTDIKVDFEMVAPKNNKTKLDAVTFQKITGWKGKTNVHSRDSAMLVYKF